MLILCTFLQRIKSVKYDDSGGKPSEDAVLVALMRSCGGDLP